MPAPSTILVTGACGFIGSHLAESLLRDGVRVVGVDNFDPFYDRSLKQRNLDAIRRADPSGLFTLAEADIRDAHAINDLYAAHTPGATLHLAGNAGVRPSIARPVDYATANVEGTTVLLDAARRTHPEGPFVLASSSSVYGNNEKTPFAEDDPVEAPISPYAATKRACELMCSTFHHLYAMPVAAVRLFTVYGPRQRPDLAISKFMRLIRASEAIPVFGDGSMSRDFTYVADTVAGIRRAMERIPDFGFRIWNLGSDRPVRLDALLEAIERTVGERAIIDRKPVPPGDVRTTYADLTRSRAELGYDAATSLEDGLRRQFEAMQHARSEVQTKPISPASTAAHTKPV